MLLVDVELQLLFPISATVMRQVDEPGFLPPTASYCLTWAEVVTVLFCLEILAPVVWSSSKSAV